MPAGTAGRTLLAAVVLALFSDDPPREDEDEAEVLYVTPDSTAGDDPGMERLE